MKSILVSVVACIPLLLYQPLTAQDPELMEQLKGQHRVEDIMRIVEHYFREQKSEHPGINNEAADEEDEFTQWARWGLYMSSRTDEQGRLVNVDQLIHRAYEQYQTGERSSTGNWIFRGPSSVTGSYGSATGIGRVNRVAFDPVNANILYIGTPDGGLFKSITDGANWTAMTDNIPSISVSGIVVSWADPNDIYILTGDGDGSNGGLETSSGYYRASAGVFKSTDGGINWSHTTNLPIAGSYGGYNLAQSPGAANTLLAATTVGLYRTTNGGISWAQVLSGATYEVKFKPGSSTIAYATQKGAFFRSEDGGESFLQVTNFGDY